MVARSTKTSNTRSHSSNRGVIETKQDSPFRAIFTTNQKEIIMLEDLIKKLEEKKKEREKINAITDKKPLWYKFMLRTMKFSLISGLFLGSAYLAHLATGINAFMWKAIAFVFCLLLVVALKVYLTMIYNWIFGTNIEP